MHHRSHLVALIDTSGKTRAGLVVEEIDREP
jgi:hypothetical protein